MISDRPLNFEYDQYQNDKFGRILAYVWIDCFGEIQVYCRGNRTFVNEIILKNGLAKVVLYQKRAKLKYQDELLQAEKEAKEKRLGIWKTP